MNRFKVGDKVRCILKSNFPGWGYPDELGYVYTVKEVLDGGGEIITEELPQAPASDPDRFELVERSKCKGEEMELERLVRVANEGRKAMVELTGKFMGQYEQPLEWSEPISIKPKPSFKPFFVGPGKDGEKYQSKWKVSLQGDLLHIGCRSFYATEAKRVLTRLCKETSENSSIGGSEIKCFARRSGVYHGSEVISWEDADRILEALEKAGV